MARCVNLRVRATTSKKNPAISFKLGQVLSLFFFLSLRIGQIERVTLLKLLELRLSVSSMSRFIYSLSDASYSLSLTAIPKNLTQSAESKISLYFQSCFNVFFFFFTDVLFLNSNSDIFNVAQNACTVKNILYFCRYFLV